MPHSYTIAHLRQHAAIMHNQVIERRNAGSDAATRADNFAIAEQLTSDIATLDASIQILLRDQIGEVPATKNEEPRTENAG